MPLTAVPPVTPFPTPPSTTDIANFDTRADAWNLQIPTFSTEMQAVANSAYANAAYALDRATYAESQATAANGFASAAQGYAASAVNAPGTNATSTTSIAIGTGSKSITIQTGKNFVAGQFITVAYTTTPTNYMFGQITSYNSGTGALVFNATSIGGSGTQAAWTVGLTGPQGSGAALPISTLAGNLTGSSNVHYQWPSGGLYALTLPPAPAVNDVIQCTNNSGSYTGCTINPNGNKINGVSGTHTFGLLNQTIDLKWSGATLGWIT